MAFKFAEDLPSATPASSQLGRLSPIIATESFALAPRASAMFTIAAETSSRGAVGVARQFPT